MMRKLVTAVAVVASFALPAVPASAGPVTDVAIVVGTGGIYPGLPNSGCIPNQRVTFTATLAVNAGDHAGLYAVSFEGSSGTNCESLTFGAGTGTLSGGVSGTVSYNRNGNVVTLTGTGAVNGAFHRITIGICEFVPTSVNPVTTYGLACQVVLGDS